MKWIPLGCSCLLKFCRMGIYGASKVIDDRSGTVQIDVLARAIESSCEVCVMNDGTVDPLYLDICVSANRSAMSSFYHVFDWVALTFCTCMVGFTVVAEVRKKH
eukprot:COSAG01_NODE_12354_length_1754_cov_1.354683_3_plen_104_part_00